VPSQIAQIELPVPSIPKGDRDGNHGNQQSRGQRGGEPWPGPVYPERREGESHHPPSAMGRALSTRPGNPISHLVGELLPGTEEPPPNANKLFHFSVFSATGAAGGEMMPQGERRSPLMFFVLVVW
jgi:hypothetical protein